MMQSVYPTYEDVLRDKIMEAAVLCIQEKGVDKTRIGDVAKKLGIARQTIYNYFSNKNALFEHVFMSEALLLAEKVSQRAKQCKGIEDKFVQAFLVAVEEFPKSPVLGHIITTGGQYLLEIGISRQTMQAFGELALGEVFNDHPYLKEQSEEICELLSRNIVSFLILPDQNPRSADELEQFVRRRIIPGIGIKKNHLKSKVTV